MFYFPKPYPDEVLGSLIIRACRHMGLSRTELVSFLAGVKRRKVLPFLLPPFLGPLGRATGLPAETLLWQHTPFPYIAAFMAPPLVSRLEGRFLHREGLPDTCGGSCTQSITQGVRTYRYCARCATEDRARYGESYWHRAHLLPAAWTCDVHGTPLLDTRVPIGNGGRGQTYHLPHELSGVAAPPLLPSEVCKALTQRTVRLLRGRSSGSPSIWTRYRDLAAQRGYARTGTQVASTRLARDLATFYGDHVLRGLGCSVDTASTQSWPALMVRPATTITFAPVKHVLLETYLNEGRASWPVHSSYRAPGKRTLNRTTRDQLFVRRLKAILVALGRREEPCGVTELLKRADCWRSYRHDRASYPRTAALLSAFKAGRLPGPPPLRRTAQKLPSP
jgi:hypothetical protein